jgi:hypothetical protein
MAHSRIRNLARSAVLGDVPGTGNLAEDRLVLRVEWFLSDLQVSIEHDGELGKDDSACRISVDAHRKNIVVLFIGLCSVLGTSVRAASTGVSAGISITRGDTLFMVGANAW